MENKDSIYKIVPFSEEYFQTLVENIKRGWGEKHVLVQSESLLRWQYHGFGQMAGMKFPLLFCGDRMIGYRLMTPIEIMLSDEHSKHTIIPSASSTLYFVDKEYRGIRLGLKLQLYTIEYYGGYFAIASNLKTSAPIHQKSGAKMLNTMYRYFRPLTDEIDCLMVGDCNHIWKLIEPQIVVSPQRIDTSTLATSWSSFVEGKNITSLNRSVDFWQWRYLDSPIYKYVFFEGKGGIIVGRICNLYNEDRSKNEKKVFRILELIPSDSNVWEGGVDNNLISLIDGICGWAKHQGCIASEFYMSTSRFGHIMEKSLFEEVNKNETLSSSIMSYFEPCAISHRLSNVTLLSPLVPDNFDFEDSYFTLSDADQDRPNIID